jgi:hypothetical protein
MAQNFPLLLNDFEAAFSSILAQKDPYNISFVELKKMKKIKTLFSEIKFLDEIYEDLSIKSFRSR